MKFYHTIIFVIFSVMSLCLCSERVTVDTTITFPTTISIEKARSETLEICRKTAVLKAVPNALEVYSHFYRNQVEVNDYYEDRTSLSSFVISANSGFITSENILKGIPVFKDNASYFSYEMTLDAVVEPVTGERDPSIQIKLHAENDNLTEGEELVIHAESSIDGFLYLFWFYEDNSVGLLFPNQYVKDNQITHKQVLTIPSKDERKNGIRFRVKGIPGNKVTTETIYAVLTHKKVPDDENLIIIGTNPDQFSAGERSYIDFQRWLSKIPLSQRDETAIQITILENDDR